MKLCSMCNKHTNKYSNSQLKKKHKRKCNDCVISISSNEEEKLYLAPLKHSCGCTMLWYVENKNDKRFLMKHIENSGQFSCPWCGSCSGIKSTAPDDGTIIWMPNAKHKLGYKRTNKESDIIDGEYNMKKFSKNQELISISQKSYLRNKMHKEIDKNNHLYYSACTGKHPPQLELDEWLNNPDKMIRSWESFRKDMFNLSQPVRRITLDNSFSKWMECMYQTIKKYRHAF